MGCALNSKNSMEQEKSIFKRISGDWFVIAKVSGYSYVYVRKVLAGERNNELVNEVAAALIAMRRQLYDRFAERRKR